MKRREFIAGIGGAAAAWPVLGLAQPVRPTIGFISSETLAPMTARLSAFRHGLSRGGSR